MPSQLASHLFDVQQAPMRVVDYGAHSFAMVGSPANPSLIAWAGLLAIALLLGGLLVRGLFRHQQRRLDLLQEALRNPALSPQAQVELVRALRNDAPRRWLFSIGWLGLFGGIAWLCTDPHREAFTAAVVTTLASFACITLPIALRELEARST